MNTRLELHKELCEILGSSNVYFQPPENLKLKYPCIVYHRSSGDTKYADNKPYTFRTRYMVTVIDPDPDSKIYEKVAMLPLCYYDRYYAADNLNHDVLNIYV